MKRFHLHIGVTDLEKSVHFYSTLFGQKPTKLKKDYAKWMLEDPYVNFAISTRSGNEGLDHLGIQVDDEKDLTDITNRLKTANLEIYGEGETTCCYAESNKAWTTDPSGIAWEAYQTMAEAEVYHLPTEENTPCCVPDQAQQRCC